MDSGLDLGPVPHERRTASVLDVLLVFAGANIVTTTLVTGGTVGNAFSWPQTILVIVAGTLAGVALLTLLARLGPRFGLPTMVLLRQPFGSRGAEAISFLLLVTNFAWIALNNVIAARALAGVVPGSSRLWSILVGAIAVVVTLFGPRAMALFNRAAVPLLLVVGFALTAAIVGAGSGKLSGPGDGSLSLLAGLDVVIGYQVSWSLMFADYTRFQRKERGAAIAVFLGMALSSLWLVGLGAAAGRIGGANDPTAMILGAGLPVAALLLMALSTITTNFVNLYLSALAVRNLWRTAPPRPTVLLVGAVGTLFGLLSPNLLEQYAGFMGWIGTGFLPIAAIVVVHFFALHRGAATVPRQWSIAAILAWSAGVATYQASAHFARLGATVPTLAVTALLYFVLARSGWIDGALRRPRTAPGDPPHRA
jgi:putative hydroxymethylpyrimidine transporter CytX